MADNRLTNEELTLLFGDKIPAKAIDILMKSPNGKSIYHVREELHELARSLRTRTLQRKHVSDILFKMGASGVSEASVDALIEACQLDPEPLAEIANEQP